MTLLIPFLWPWNEAVKGQYINREKSSCLCVVLSRYERQFLVYECRFALGGSRGVQMDRGGVDASQESGCAVVSGYALREGVASVRVSCCRRVF